MSAALQRVRKEETCWLLSEWEEHNTCILDFCKQLSGFGKKLTGLKGILFNAA